MVEIWNSAKRKLMINQNSFDPENQCELSYELLYLLKWLFDHESVTLKKLIDRAVKQGFKQEIHNADVILEKIASEEIQNSIVDFLDLLDTLLHESLNEHSLKKAQQINLMPSVNKIDSNICDRDTVQWSLEKATSHIEKHPEINPKELLFKEILRRWKPSKKKHLN